MYKQIFIPSEQNNSVLIPPKWYGREVEVIVFPTREDSHQEVDLYAESQRILQQAKVADISEMDKIFETHLFSLKGFKFDRDVANDYD